MLIYQEIVGASTAGTPTLIALHGSGGFADQLVPLCRGVCGSATVIAPQAARPLNMANRSYTPEEDQGYRWYFGDRGAAPEPATLGESLWNLERFVSDVRARQPAQGRLFLVGFEQGAVVAVTMATIVPDWLAGVVAIGGHLPEIRGWSPPAEQLDGLPFLLLHDPEGSPHAIAEDLRTVQNLRARGATVTSAPVPGVDRDPLRATESIRAWLETLPGGNRRAEMTTAGDNPERPA